MEHIAPLTLLIIENLPRADRGGNTTSLPPLISASLHTVILVLKCVAIFAASHEAVWFVCSNITQPDSAQRVRTQWNQCTALSSVQIRILSALYTKKKDRQSHYTQECAGTHTHPSLAHWIGLIQTYQHACQPQPRLSLLSPADGLRWAKAVSLSPFTLKSQPVCHTSGQHMLRDTAAPLLSFCPFGLQTSVGRPI